MYRQYHAFVSFMFIHIFPYNKHIFLSNNHFKFFSMAFLSHIFSQIQLKFFTTLDLDNILQVNVHCEHIQKLEYR